VAQDIKEVTLDLVAHSITDLPQSLNSFNQIILNQNKACKLKPLMNIQFLNHFAQELSIFYECLTDCEAPIERLLWTGVNITDTHKKKLSV